MTDPAPEVVPELLVTPLAERLLACLCAELEKSLAGPVCQCCLRIGGKLPPMDVCCSCEGGQGQASVQVVKVFPSSGFPIEGLNVRRLECTDWQWAARLQLVVYRCVSTVDDAGNPPDCDHMAYDARKIWSDAAAMRRALACCEWAGDAAVVPEAWTPVDEQGACAGGRMTVLVELGPECCPDE